METEKLGIASDHAGLGYKEMLKELLSAEGYKIRDFGLHKCEPVYDYKFVEELCCDLIAGGIDRGICICGTGIAVSIAANKIKGIRAAVCNDIYTAGKSREHNNSNIICIGARVIGEDVAKEIIKKWLTTGFAGGRHEIRNNFITSLEEKYMI